MTNSRSLLATLLIGVVFSAGCSTVGSSKLASDPATAPIAQKPSPTPPPSLLVAASVSPDLQTSKLVQQYLGQLVTQGFSDKSQGVWMQASDVLLANHQGTVPLPAASLTKVATYSRRLQRWGLTGS
ncbi:MAG: D-alanyl-D-alanine carboxypeptidase, partial [Leptolyngbyaceae cyanobacterium CSU_1_3]|nr:D-alanyl-D-alanine carboxypeptidase [Leptolyngbyaceae cyanobacterium CSU_1_3]